MALETPVSQSETPTPKVEQTQKTPEKKLTPEQLEQRVLEEALELSWLTKEDLQKFYKECSTCNLETLKKEIQTTPEEQLIEKKAKELYKEYLEKGLKSWNENVVSLDSLSKSIDSPRIEDLKGKIESALDWALKKYDFLDKQTKEFVKIWIVNSMLKSPVWEIWESLVWGFANFIEKLSTIKQDDLSWMVSALKTNPTDSWRTLTLEEKFAGNLWNYTKKFDEIQKKLDWVEPKLSPEKKYNIISHVDWFRNPASIEAWVNWLDISQLKIENKDKKNETPLDTKSISEYMVNSREKILEVSKKLNLWDKAWDTIYSLVEGWGMVWEWVQKIIEVILKLPFIGKFFAIFLGLNPDPEKALNELKENSSNFKYLSSLKSLWAEKDKQWKTIEWKEPFKNIDLSQIHFNWIKDEIKEVKAIFGDVKDEELSAKWQEAFTKWIEKDWITIKFELWDKKDWKLSSSEFKKILKEWLWKFENDKQENKVKEDNEKREKEKAENTRKTQELDSGINTLKSQVENINSIINKDYEKIRHWDDLLNVWDINDIKTQDIINHDWKDFKEIIEKNLKTGSLNDLTEENITLINNLFSYINEYCKEKTLSNQWEIKDFLKNNETWFNTWLENKKTELTKQKEWKEKELATLNWNEEKLKFAENIWEIIKKATDWTSLSKWLDVWENKKLSFDNTKQELNIWDERFKISWIDATLKDIIIDWSDKVKFEWTKFWFSGTKDVLKNTFINWLQQLVLNWKFEFKDKDGNLIKIDKA